MLHAQGRLLCHLPFPALAADSRSPPVCTCSPRPSDLELQHPAHLPHHPSFATTPVTMPAGTTDLGVFGGAVSSHRALLARQRQPTSPARPFAQLAASATAPPAAAATAGAKKELSLAVKFATAGLGGIAGWVVVHPANTLAVRLNLSMAASSATGKTPAFVPFAADVIRREGVLTLYKGLTAGITRQIFYATSRFGLFEVFRDKLAEYRPTDIWSRLSTGLASGACAAYIACPAEVTLVRMSNDMSLPVAERRGYTNVVHAAYRIVREEGVMTFWRGSVPFVSRAMLVGACQVATYDQFKQLYRQQGITHNLSNTFCAAFTAGLIYSLITMPFETAKNRMAFQKPDPATGQLLYRGTMQTIGQVAKTGGPLTLWSGFFPYYLRCGGHTVCMFIAVEQLRNRYLASLGDEAE